jgi:Tfp pilus assembly protein PilN
MMKIDINLSVKRRRRSVVPNMVAIGLLLMAAAYTWHNAELYRFNQSQITLLGEQLTRLEKTLEAKGSPVPTATREDIKLLREEAVYINKLIVRETFSWTELLTSLEKKVPKGVSIVQISPEFETRTIKVSGMAKSKKDVLRLVDRLGRSDEFSDVFLLKHKDVVKKDAVDKSFVTFNVSAKYLSGERL